MIGYPRETYLKLVWRQYYKNSHDPIIIIPAEQQGLGHYMEMLLRLYWSLDDVIEARKY